MNYQDVFDPERHSTQNPSALASVNQLAVPGGSRFLRCRINRLTGEPIR